MIVGYVFGYGSLVSKRDHLLQDLPSPAIYGYLQDHARTWKLAIDNSSAKGKYYLRPDGKRYQGEVATLGIKEASGIDCNGVAVPVDKQLLAKLDKREDLLYKRVGGLQDLFSVPLDGELWTYYPSKQAMETYQRGSAVLPKSYLDTCRQAFSEWSKDGWKKFLYTTEKLECPLLDLRLYREPGWAGI